MAKHHHHHHHLKILLISWSQTHLLHFNCIYIPLSLINQTFFSLIYNWHHLWCYFPPLFSSSISNSVIFSLDQVRYLLFQCWSFKSYSMDIELYWDILTILSRWLWNFLSDLWVLLHYNMDKAFFRYIWFFCV